jgi:hypothetical protein
VVSLDDLLRKLERLELGETEVLTQRQFIEIFAGRNASPDEQKLAAAEFGESTGCRVLFTGEEAMFVLFTRRQGRRDLRLGLS